MGNQMNLANVCMSATQMCTQSEQLVQPKQSTIMLKRHHIKTTQQIKQKIRKYIQQNKLQLYSTRQRKVFQTLVSVGQQNVGQEILYLDKRIKELQKEKKQIKWQKQRQKNKRSINTNLDGSQQRKQNNENKITKKDVSNSQSQKLQSISINNQNNDQYEDQDLLQNLRQKRVKLFQQAECLLLEDLDMVFGQIDKFDQNKQHIQNILTLTHSMLMAKNNNTSTVGSKTDNLQGTNNHKDFVNQINQRNIHTSQINIQKTTPNFLNTQINSSRTDKAMANNKSVIFAKEVHQQQKSKSKLNIQKQKLLKQTIKIQDKKVLKKNQAVLGIGGTILKNNQLLVIAPIQCFSGVGVLLNNYHTGLPSHSSLLQIFINKVKSVNKRRNCTLGLAFLVNQNYVKLFKQQMSKITDAQNIFSYTKQKPLSQSHLSNHPSDFNNQIQFPLIKYHIIQYKNSWPSFNQEYKISIDQQQHQMEFSYQNGDLISFIQNSVELKSLIEKYKFVNFTNLNNMLSQIGDSVALGYLQINQSVDIAVKVLKPFNINSKINNDNKQFQLSQFFDVDPKGFIEFKNHLSQDYQQNQPQEIENSNIYRRNRNFLNIQDYYIKSRIFTTQSGPLKRLLLSRISRQITTNSQFLKLSFYLKRDISNILYSKYTTLITVQQQYQFSHVKSKTSQQPRHLVKNGQIGYSRYCKKILGLNNSQPDKQLDQLVQIDAGILHKGSDQIIQLIRKVQEIKQIGFPIVLYTDFCQTDRPGA